MKISFIYVFWNKLLSQSAGIVWHRAASFLCKSLASFETLKRISIEVNFRYFLSPKVVVLGSFLWALPRDGGLSPPISESEGRNYPQRTMLQFLTIIYNINRIPAILPIIGKVQPFLIASSWKLERVIQLEVFRSYFVTNPKI